MNKIKIPTHAVECRNLNCKSHYNDIDIFHNNIVNACITAGQKVLPSTGKGDNGKNVKAGWNDYCKDKR